MTARAIVHLVPHTHWDREWYEPFQTFRMRLVDLVDRLLEQMALDPRLRFTLDGQVATVDDYLEIRPEAEPLIRRLIAEERLAIGPWQILMDEFLVSGETIVRNLELGWARSEELGGAMPVGYLPDMFGHIAQMPQILRRAGIDRAVVWRGVPACIDRNAFRWIAPDGSEVEAEYLPGGYGNGAYLFDVPDRLAEKLAAYRAANAPVYGERSFLAMYGTDHAVPSPRLADLVDAVNRDATDVEVRLETLADYEARPGSDAGDGSSGDGMPLSWTGELRSAARANMLMGVTSARIDIKMACARAERLLERYAEPLAALHADGWPERFLELAWRRVIDDSAHDSICGCSLDAVVDQVLTRFAEAEQIAQGIVKATGRRIAAGVPVASWAVLNPSPVARVDLVSLDVAVSGGLSPAFSVDGVPVVSQEVGRRDPLIERIRLRGDDIPAFLTRRRHGRELFGRQINGVRVDPESSSRTITLLVDDIAQPAELDVDEVLDAVAAAVATVPDEPWQLDVLAPDHRQVLVRVPVPALGWAPLSVEEADEAPDPAGDGGTPGNLPIVSAGDRTLSNGLVDLSVDEDGTFRVRGAGAELAGVGRLVDGGDFGDSYDYAPPADDRTVQMPDAVRVERTQGGPLVGELVVHRRYEWPLAVEASGAKRTDAAVPTEVVTRLELRADEPFVRVRIEFENRSRDHRLRWHIPLPEPARTSAAEGQFAVVERGLAMEGGHGEVPLPTYPARAFVHAAGVSVLLDHVTEYELVDGGAELALTVLRSIGLISRNANPYREDPAGPEVPIPAAQLLGPWTCGFAILPHADGWSEAGVPQAVERYRHPFLAFAGTGTGAPHGPAAPTGVSVDGPGVVLSALRRRGDELELRLVAEHPVRTQAVVRGSFREARRVDLLGRHLGALEVTSSSLRLPLEAWEISTIRLR